MEDTSFQLTLSENHENEISTEHNENFTQRIPLLRSQSEGASIAERSLITDDCGVNPKIKILFFNNCLCSLDEFIATPSFNIGVIENACDQDFNFFDTINESNHVVVIDGVMASLSLFAVSIGIYVTNYCKLREIEQNSNYFFFCRLLKTYYKEKIENKLEEIEQDNDDGEARIPHEVLQSIVKFYPPDISKIACWRRRFFASKIEREQLNVLNTLFRNTKEEMLDKLYKKITDLVCKLLNREAELQNFQTKRYKNTWIIGLSEHYKSKFFEHVQYLIKDNQETTLNNNKIKTYIAAFLISLRQASFIYWILIFIFYFISMAPAVTAAQISIIPLAITLLGVLPIFLIYKLCETYRAYNTLPKFTSEDIEKQNKEILEKK